MRAIHEASVEDVYNPRRRSELNTNYVTIATLSGNLTDIDFQPDSFAVALAPGEQGLNAIEASWDGASGVFDHYRLYYSLEGGGAANGIFPDLCQTPAVSPPTETVYCKKVDFAASSTALTGLQPYTTYEVVLVLCATNGCAMNERIVAPAQTIITDPAMPSFNGLRQIDVATTLSQLGKLYLRFDPPNFSLGYFDGLVLKMRRTLDGSDAEEEITTNSPGTYHQDYNFILENQIVVEGIDYLSDAPYCFTLYPFKWDADGVTRREEPNGIWRCVNPKPEAPRSDQFSGLGAGIVEGGIVNLTWDAPTGGVFSHYELFWRKQSGELFNWGDAIAEAGNSFDYTNYGRRTLDPEELSVSLTHFTNGVYSFGMITYYNYVTENGAVVLRSETNGNILKCTVDHSDPEPVNCI